MISRAIIRGAIIRLGIHKSNPIKNNLALGNNQRLGPVLIGNLARDIEQGQNTIRRRKRLLGHRIQSTNATNWLDQQNQSGDKGNHISDLHHAIRHTPPSQRNNTANRNTANNLEYRINLGTAGQQPDKPVIQPIKRSAGAANLAFFQLIGLYHTRTLQGLGQQRCHAFHMRLQITGRFALAIADLDNRLHR